MTFQRKAANILLTAALVFLGTTSADANPARILRHPHAVPGRWMVLLSPNITKSAFDGVVTSLAKTYDLTITTRWPERSLGFICENASDTNISKLADDPRVDLIEQDFELVFSATQASTWNGQYLWFLDRLDEPTYWVNDSTYDMCPEARSVYAYVIDMGVRTDHEQFNLREPSNRVVYSRTFDDNTATGSVDTTSACTQGGIVNYDLFHGTAVASALAGTTVGASKTQVVSLRIIGCNRQSDASWVVNAVQWIRSANDPYAAMPGVVNMSSALPPWQSSADISTLNAAVNALVTRTGIPFFTAADNFAGDACQFTPASLAYTNVNRSGTVFSVGGSSPGAGTDKNDYRWQKWDPDGQASIGPDAGSNGGRCVSMYAPGIGIYGARTTSPTAYGFADGTSFSSPLVAGVAARYMERTGVRNYTQVYDHLLSAASATGTVVNHVNTVEYWLCAPLGLNPQYYTSRTNPGTCPQGYVGVNGTSTPIHMVPTFNESNAGMIYSDMTCP